MIEFKMFIFKSDKSCFFYMDFFRGKVQYDKYMQEIIIICYFFLVVVEGFRKCNLKMFKRVNLIWVNFN